MSMKDVLSKLNTPIGGEKERKGKASAPGGEKKKSGGSKSKQSENGGKVKIVGKAKRVKTRDLPTKRSINLAAVGVKKPIRVKSAVPLIVIVVVAALILGKFAVLDRLLAVSRAESEVASLQTQLSSAYHKLESFGEMSEEYAHYTYEDMTDEELARTDRVEVLDLIQRVVLPQASLSGWTITENLLTLDISQASLQEINLLAQQLNGEPLVNFTTVHTAATNDKRNDAEQTVYSKVDGQILVYLNSTATEEGAQ